MKEIINNNIECISPNGEVKYSHFEWLKTFIRLLKAEMKDSKEDFRNTLSYKILGYLNGIISHKDKSTEITSKVYTPAHLDEAYFARFRKALEEGKEVEVKGWKFRVV